MKIINIDTTDSTNTFLKDLLRLSDLDDFTVVRTDRQLSGRGQMNNKWHSQDYKNLTFSVLCKFDHLELSEQRYLNFAVSLALFDFLNELGLPKVVIKWPNDILSDKYKICGVLIENFIKEQNLNYAIVGIGLNVNQTKFPKNIGNPSSVKLLTGINYELDRLLDRFLDIFYLYVQKLKSMEYDSLESGYLKSLYLLGKPHMFKSNNRIFMGMIKGVSKNGNLLIELEDESIKQFGVKEISFL